jgi:hypothetical protein
MLLPMDDGEIAAPREVRVSFLETGTSLPAPVS